MRLFGRILFFLVAWSSVLPAQSIAPDTQTGNFLYKMPNGWSPVEKGGATVVYAPRSPQGTVTYFALAANDLEGDLQNSFAHLWQGFRSSYRILEGGQTSPLHSNKGYDAFYSTAVAADSNGIRWSVYVMGAQYKNRIQTVMFMSNLPPGRILSAYQRVFQQTFLASLNFGDALPGSRIPR